MKDFKNSYDQKRGEFAVERHSEACQKIAFLTGKQNFEWYVEYWTKVRNELEEQFPIPSKSRDNGV